VGGELDDVVVEEEHAGYWGGFGRSVEYLVRGGGGGGVGGGSGGDGGDVVVGPCCVGVDVAGHGSLIGQVLHGIGLRHADDATEAADGGFDLVVGELGGEGGLGKGFLVAGAMRALAEEGVVVFGAVVVVVDHH